MTHVIEVYGARFLISTGLFALYYLVWTSAPLWWAALRALRRSRRLPRPLLFTLTSACLTYAAYLVTVLLLVVPTGPLRLQLEQSLLGHGIGATIVETLCYSLPMLLLSGTVSGYLAARWEQICRALAPHADVRP